MAKTVWKFSLQHQDEQQIEIPAGAQILCVQVQQDTPCLWATVNPKEPLEKRTILIRGTGHTALEGDLTYIGTYQTMGGMFVWHVFEKIS